MRMIPAAYLGPAIHGRSRLTFQLSRIVLADRAVISEDITVIAVPLYTQHPPLLAGYRRGLSYD